MRSSASVWRELRHRPTRPSPPDGGNIQIAPASAFTAPVKFITFCTMLLSFGEPTQTQHIEGYAEIVLSRDYGFNSLRNNRFANSPVFPFL